MALETLEGVKTIGDFKVMQDRPRFEDGTTDWRTFDEMRKHEPIFVDQDQNMISFKLQKGPVGKNGVNGCQVVTLIETALLMIEKLNDKVPCMENDNTIAYLKRAIWWQTERSWSRERRGVEGTNQP